MFFLLLEELSFIFYLLSLQLVLCCLVAIKSGPYIVHSAVYILILVLWDQQNYSEKSENIIGLDSYILGSLNYLNLIWICISHFMFAFKGTHFYILFDIILR